MTESLTREQVRADIAELLDEEPAELPDDEDLMDWGLDSVRVMSLVERWRKQGVHVAFADLAERPTVADWWAVLKSKMD